MKADELIRKLQMMPPNTTVMFESRYKQPYHHIHRVGFRSADTNLEDDDKIILTDEV